MEVEMLACAGKQERQNRRFVRAFNHRFCCSPFSMRPKIKLVFLEC